MRSYLPVPLGAPKIRASQWHLISSRMALSVERGVCARDEALRRVVRLHMREPDGDRAVLGATGKIGVDSFEAILGLGHAETCYYTDEFVASVANDDVVGTQSGLQGVRDFEQRGVARGMAQRIVDGLEAVHVNVGDYQRLPCPSRPRHLACHFDESWATQIHPRQSIDGGAPSLSRRSSAIGRRTLAVKFRLATFAGSGPSIS